MRYMRIAFAMIVSVIKLSIKKVFGCRVSFGWINLISPFAHVYTECGGRIEIGRKSGIRSNTEIKANGGKIEIGDNCFINRNCMIVAHENIRIEDEVTIGPNTVIYDHDHDIIRAGGYVSAPVKIENGAWIGANCVILKGVTIGKCAVIAAGSVVTKDVPAHTVLYQKRENMEKYLTDA